LSAACKPAVARDQCFVPQRLERVFADCFLASCCTRLVGGALEPLYQPATKAGGLHLLWYREDYFASALHETAHWCIAGKARRQQTDFGYWYAPDGRSQAQQQAFEAAESRPQALEWLFSRACGFSFCLSTDNLNAQDGSVADNSDFQMQVFAQARHWQERGLPARAAQFYRALCREFGTAQDVSGLHLSRDELR
jgi:hypothetical protein